MLKKRIIKKDLVSTPTARAARITAALLAVFVFTGIVIKVRSGSADILSETQTSFVFTAAGDWSGSSRTSANLDAIAASGAVFNLALGDLSYSSITPETAWCDYVKSHVGANFPFQLVTGNHENAPTGDDGYIDNFASCLPDRMNSIPSATSRYGWEYYFDYLNVRVLMLPADNADGADPYSYTAGSVHYNWLKDRISEARSSGKWVVVGMHKNCITIGVKSCSIGTDLMNLLIQERVDLVLQGHDHNYQRSKQLSCATQGTYNSACVADDGTDGMYTKGVGTVFVIVGTGGAGLYDVNTNDSEAGYFASWMGNNSNPRHGFLKMTATESSLSAVYFGTTNGTFSDSFEIISGAATPTPTLPTEATPTATPAAASTPTPTNIPSPTLTTSPTPTPANQIAGTLLADANIRKSSANKNYGAATKLEADNSPVKQFLLKFRVTGVSDRSIQSAKLRLYNTDKSNSGGSIYKASHNNWSEQNVTWNNAPSTSGLALAVLGQVTGTSTAPVLYETDVTSAVTGDGEISFRVTTTSADGADYLSKEGSMLQAPQLIVTVQ